MFSVNCEKSGDVAVVKCAGRIVRGEAVYRAALAALCLTCLMLNHWMAVAWARLCSCTVGLAIMVFSLSW